MVCTQLVCGLLARLWATSPSVFLIPDCDVRDLYFVILGPKKQIWIPRKCWSEKRFGQKKNLCLKKMLCLKTIVGPENKLLGPKYF